MNKFLVLGVAGVLILGFALLAMYIGFNNHNVKLRTNVEARQLVVENHVDKAWKTISQTAQVPEELANESKEAFKEIYLPMMENRYGNARGGSLMSWITENHPNYDMAALAKLYENVQVVVKSERMDLANKQDQLIDAHRAHVEYMNLKHVGWLLDKRDTLAITIVTSSVAKEAIETGKDDNVDLFKKD